MTTSIFPSRWPPEHPDRIQLYSLATPNGQKVSIALEEMELAYEPHRIGLGGDQFDPEFVALNPNSKIPAIIDPDGPGGEPIAMMESGAILMYLAQKSGRFLPADERLRAETIQWLFFQMASVGPMFGQFGHFFKFARDKTSDDYAVNRYSDETRRLLGVLETRLEGRTFLVGEQYSIADMATFPWVDGLSFYGGLEHLDYSSFTSVNAWVQRCASRPATARGRAVNR